MSYGEEVISLPGHYLMTLWVVAGPHNDLILGKTERPRFGFWNVYGTKDKLWVEKLGICRNGRLYRQSLITMQRAHSLVLNHPPHFTFDRSSLCLSTTGKVELLTARWNLWWKLPSQWPIFSLSHRHLSIPFKEIST